LGPPYTKKAEQILLGFFSVGRYVSQLPIRSVLSDCRLAAPLLHIASPKNYL